MRSRKMWAALALALVLGGCSTDDEPSEPGPSGSTTSAGAPATGPTSASEGGNDGPEAATGTELDAELVSLRLPAGEGWVVSRGGASGQLDVERDYYQVHLSHGLGTAPDLDTAVAAVLPTVTGLRPEVARIEDRIVAGVETAVLSGVDDDGYFYGLVAIHQGLVMTIQFEFPRKDAEGTATIESILASVEWK